MDLVFMILDVFLIIFFTSIAVFLHPHLDYKISAMICYLRGMYFFVKIR
jgi:hypothetical protein